MPELTPTAATPLKLARDLGIDHVAGLRDELANRLGEAGTVKIDASDVERIHTAALQLFCLFCRDRRRDGHDVEFLHPSESLRNAAALLGATTLLQLAKAAS